MYPSFNLISSSLKIVIRTDMLFQTSLAPNHFLSQTLETKAIHMKLIRNSSLFLGQKDYFKKIRKKYFCIWCDLKICLKQCDNKIRSAISFAHRGISMHVISVLLLMRIIHTSKPGLLESIVKFRGRFRFSFFFQKLGFLSALETSAIPV